MAQVVKVVNLTVDKWLDNFYHLKFTFAHYALLYYFEHCKKWKFVSLHSIVGIETLRTLVVNEVSEIEVHLTLSIGPA